MRCCDIGNTVSSASIHVIGIIAAFQAVLVFALIAAIGVLPAIVINGAIGVLTAIAISHALARACRTFVVPVIAGVPVVSVLRAF